MSSHADKRARAKAKLLRRDRLLNQARDQLRVRTWEEILPAIQALQARTGTGKPAPPAGT